MVGLHYLSYFFGGLFLFNSIPHITAGMMGKAFQSPFAKPRGVGLSSSTVNVIWGMFNLSVGYMLILKVGDFDFRNVMHATVAGLGGFLIALHLARHFGQFHGGNNP